MLTIKQDGEVKNKNNYKKDTHTVHKRRKKKGNGKYSITNAGKAGLYVK